MSLDIELDLLKTGLSELLLRLPQPPVAFLGVPSTLLGSLVLVFSLNLGILNRLANLPPALFCFVSSRLFEAESSRDFLASVEVL